METETEPAEAPTGSTDATEGPPQFSGSFDDFALPNAFKLGLKELGYVQPTHVQAAVFGHLAGGKDVLVQSKTGSGKTTAFCLPILTKLDAGRPSPQALTLCPTRELALQVATEAGRLGHHSGLKVATIYGGASMRAQIESLRSGVHFVVGTPGRVKDLFRQGHLRFDDIKFAVLDEADEMLSRGFWDEVTSILDQLPVQRQTALFSATLPPEVERAANKYLRAPERIDLSRDTVNVSTIRHVLHHEREMFSKPRNFLYVLEFHKPKSAIVFCNRRDETEMICSYLKRFGFRAEALNGDMPQKARERTLERVKAGELDLMVATDIAARGIDISDLGHVFNYDLPEHDEVYIHRVGRTGRIGKKGVAVSLVRGKYLAHLAQIKKQFKVPFEEIELPDEKEILWMQAERLAVQILEAADGVEMEQYRPVAEAMLQRGDIKEILSFLLRTHFSQQAQAQRAREERLRDERMPGGERREAPHRERRERLERRPRMDRDDRRHPEGEPPQPDGGGREETRDDGGAKNIYVTLGRDDGIADMTALIAKLSELSGVDIGHFTGHGDVRDHSSHLEVDAEVADRLIAGVHGKPRGDKMITPEGGGEPVPATIVCEYAKGGGRRPRRRRRR